MKVKNGILLLITIIILTGCNLNPFGNDRPEDISKEYYEMFVDSYELYEDRVRKYDGEFLDSNNELLDFDDEYENGHFTNGSIVENYREGEIRKEKGKKGLLTDKEDQLLGDFLALYEIKQLDHYTEDQIGIMLENHPEYADPTKATIDLEKKVIRTMELDKTSVSEEISTDGSDRISGGKQDENISPNDTFVYENKEHGFKLRLPESWSGRYNINENDFYEGAEARIVFDFVHGNYVVSNIFSLLIFDEREFYGKHDGGYIVPVVTHNGKIYASSSPPEVPEELWESENKVLLDEFLQMVNEDVPIIMESIKFD